MKQIKDYNYYATTCGKILNKNGKPICLFKDNVGYYQCVLHKEGKRIRARVHRLIALAFLEKIENKNMVNHIDGNKLNNSILNIEWTNNSENQKHAYSNNLYLNKKRKHEVYALNKTTKEKKEYISIRSMCEDLKLNRKTVSSILKKEKKNNYSFDFGYLGECGVQTTRDECSGGENALM